MRRHKAEIESWRRKDVIYFRNDGSVRYVTSTYTYLLRIIRGKFFFKERMKRILCIEEKEGNYSFHENASCRMFVCVERARKAESDSHD